MRGPGCEKNATPKCRSGDRVGAGLRPGAGQTWNAAKSESISEPLCLSTVGWKWGSVRPCRHASSTDGHHTQRAAPARRPLAMITIRWWSGDPGLQVRGGGPRGRPGATGGGAPRSLSAGRVAAIRVVGWRRTFSTLDVEGRRLAEVARQTSVVDSSGAAFPELGVGGGAESWPGDVTLIPLGVYGAQVKRLKEIAVYRVQRSRDCPSLVPCLVGDETSSYVVVGGPGRRRRSALARVSVS